MLKSNLLWLAMQRCCHRHILPHIELQHKQIWAEVKPHNDINEDMCHNIQFAIKAIS